MLDKPRADAFPTINRAYGSVFRPDRLSIGLVLPLESFAVGGVPTMARHLEIAQIAEQRGFSALWLRDVPFNVPSFGDVGQIFDPFVYLGALATATDRIALGVASIVLPLRHPAHVAKAAATADILSGGRLLLGIASGDRPEEFPALNMTYPDRGVRFRESVDYMRALEDDYPQFENAYGSLTGAIDMLPKPAGGRTPMLITGGSQQSPDWVAQNGDGWMTYPRDPASQTRVIADYRQRVKEAGGASKPVMQSLYVDLVADVDARPHPIHLGFRSGANALCGYLQDIHSAGVNHVAFNLRFNQADIPSTLDRLADALFPEFGS